MTAWRSSLRFRMLLTYSGVYLVLLAATAAGGYLAVRQHLVHHSRERLEGAISEIQRLLAENPGELEELERHKIVPWFLVRWNGRTIHRTVLWDRAGLRIPESPDADDHEWLATDAQGHAYRAAFRRSRSPAGERVIAAAVRDDELVASLATLRLVLLGAIPLALAGGLVAGVLAARSAVQPLDEIVRTIGNISDARLDERIDPAVLPGELKDLARSFNDLLERLEEAFSQLRSFTADASHELRTPLMAMRAVGEVSLRRRMSSEQYREVIGSLLEEAERLTHVSETMLQLTRMEVDCGESAPQQLELCDACESVVEQFAVLAEERRQRLELSCSWRGQIVAPAEPLRTVLRNLVDNAIRHCPEGTTIAVRLAERGGRPVIEVEDDGPGIPPELRGRVFDRFVRGDTSRAGRSGTGLGLAIARRAARCLGADLELESGRRGGSLFRLAFSRPIPAAGARPKAAAGTGP